MLKVVGSILIVGTTTLWGMVSAAQVRNQYEQMRLLEQLLTRLKSELLYSRTYLCEVFSDICADYGEPYNSWMKNMYQRMKNRTKGSFSSIWKDSIDECLTGCGLPEKDRMRLRELGDQLGNADLDGQIRSIDLYLDEFNRSMEDKREGMKNKEKICRCLGVMSGIFIIILLI